MRGSWKSGTQVLAAGSSEDHPKTSGRGPDQRKVARALSGAESLSLVSDSATLKLLVVVPALNEASTVGHVVSKVPRDIPGIAQVAVVVVDDGSTDGTGSAACQAGARVIRHDRPQGVGVVFHRALELVVDEAADILVFIDGDGQFNAGDIRKVIRPIVEGQADCVTASRYHPESPPHRQALGRRVGNLIMSRLVSALIRRRIYDAACGFRAYSATAALKLNLTGRFTYTQETLLDIAFMGGRIVEVPIRVRGTRKHGKSRVAHSLLGYGWRALMIILRAYRDYKPLRFFGSLALVQFAVASCLGGFFLLHFLKTGRFSPHLWAGLTAGFLFIMGALTSLTGVLADMLDRVRLNQEQLLFHERLRRYEIRKVESGRSSQAARHYGAGPAQQGSSVSGRAASL
ncbi:MAG TPA: glycosyltransferase family 2 protein [Phycisphaerae bacterium]|nr:glycosyltransferase family 2 protein [Phycisphaerae bacterium]